MTKYLYISCILLALLGCKSELDTDIKSTLVLNLVDEQGKLDHKQDTGIPFISQSATDRIFKELQIHKVGEIDLSDDYYLYMSVYNGYPCAIKMTYSVVDCFDSDASIVHRFGAGKGRGPAELLELDRQAILHDGTILLSDFNNRIQKIVAPNGTELLMNIQRSLDSPAHTVASNGTTLFVFTGSLFLTEPTLVYFERQFDGSWLRVNGANLYDQLAPVTESLVSDDPTSEISRDLVAVPDVYTGILAGHSDNDFYLVSMYSGLLIRLDNKKATFARNLITSPINNEVTLQKVVQNVPEAYRASYAPPIYYLKKLEGRRFYTYGLTVQNNFVYNIDHGQVENVRGIIIDTYHESDGSYSHSYFFDPQTSVTYLGIQLYQDKLFILNGDGNILVFELKFSSISDPNAY